MCNQATCACPETGLCIDLPPPSAAVRGRRGGGVVESSTTKAGGIGGQRQVQSGSMAVLLDSYPLPFRLRFIED
jgi:hypothetical protein